MKRTDDPTQTQAAKLPHFRQTADSTEEQWPAASLSPTSEKSIFYFVTKNNVKQFQNCHDGGLRFMNKIL